ncbi:MAG: DUF523 domain-containing protein [Acholeplasmatales bacterium]|nr:DUF523 domain-containing protein [Acholeplasmatales bacterium]
MEKLLISAYILGINCKYNGKNNYNPLVEKLKERYILIPICPEEMGGLSTPRNPSEILNDKVISSKGDDVTNNFFDGANKALDIVKKENISKALLKEGSPSCGSNYIYDGTFTKTKINGMGFTARLLKNNNIKIYTEDEIELLLK